MEVWYNDSTMPEDELENTYDIVWNASKVLVERQEAAAFWLTISGWPVCVRDESRRDWTVGFRVVGTGSQRRLLARVYPGRLLDSKTWT